MASTNLAQEITTHLLSRGLHPSPTWLTTTFLPTIRPTTPLPALKQTALFRLLASDITQTLQRTPSSVFPPDIHNATIRERRLAGPIAVQVLDIEDIGRSRWSQAEALEAAERGETTKGREIIRAVPAEDGGEGPDADADVAGSGGPHKLVLQDAQGVRVFGIELTAVEGVGVGMNIGAKIVLRDVLVARGVVLLEPGSVKVEGGKIEGAHKAWKEGRKERLKSAAGITERG